VQCSVGEERDESGEYEGEIEEERTERKQQI
jgi:hypothetical protein